MVREHQTSDVQLHIGESRDSGFDAEPVIGPRLARTRWHRPEMTSRSIVTVIARESGRSSMPRLLDSITIASGILDRPLSRTMTAVNVGDERAFLYSPISFSHSSSISTATPCFLASASFEPAPGPATT